MISNTITKEKTAIINTLLAETGVTLEELLKSYESNRQALPDAAPVRYLSVAEACRLCSVSRFTVYRWIRKGWVRAHKLTLARGGKVLIDADSVFRHVESCGTTGKY
jgi:excisionase family DNA binding protein